MVFLQSYFLLPHRQGFRFHNSQPNRDHTLQALRVHAHARGLSTIVGPTLFTILIVNLSQKTKLNPTLRGQSLGSFHEMESVRYDAVASLPLVEMYI